MLRTIDLFCGAGGLSDGFRQAGFATLLANDIEAPALETFKQNFSGVPSIAGDIRGLDAATLRNDLGLKQGDLDALIGGPPCQGFSTYGQRKEDDHRNLLYREFIRFLQEFMPKTFVIENVTGIISMSKGSVISQIAEDIELLGYSVNVSVLDATAYGVPQSRRRVFIFGGRDNALIKNPQPTHSSSRKRKAAGKISQSSMFDDEAHMPKALTVRDAIGDLPRNVLRPRQTHDVLAYENGPSTEYQKLMRGDTEVLTHHSAKQMLGIRHLRLALLHPGDYGNRIEERLMNGGLPEETINRLLGSESLRDLNQCRTEDRKKEIALRQMLSKGNTSLSEIMEFLDSQGFANKYRRLDWDAPSHTLVAHMARDCSDFVHPEIDRFVSVREAARLQSFADSYYFTGSQFQQFRQIGNAVPPLLAKAIAEKISEALT